MTSRARRIVLAMYGHREYTPTPVLLGLAELESGRRYRMHAPGCYEAMDDVDPITADLPRSPIVGGNYGLPCA